MLEEPVNPQTINSFADSLNPNPKPNDSFKMELNDFSAPYFDPSLETLFNEPFDSWNNLPLFDTQLEKDTLSIEPVVESVNSADSGHGSELADILNVDDDALGDIKDIEGFLSNVGSPQNADDCADDIFGSGNQDLVDYMHDALTQDPAEFNPNVMWCPSHNDILNSSSPTLASTNSRRRRRDVSLTLNECTAGLWSVKDMKCRLASSSPTHTCNTSTCPSLNLETPMPSSESETDTASTDDEEIDVVNADTATSARVSSCAFKSSSSSFRATPGSSSSPASMLKSKQTVKPGRSLLINKQQNLKQRKKAQKQKQKLLLQKQQQQQKKALDEQQAQLEAFSQSQSALLNHIIIDHCYSMLTPPPPPSLTPPIDAQDRLSFVGASSNPPNVIVDKHKIVQAVKSLINKGPGSVNGDDRILDGIKDKNIKFKFKMRFESNDGHNKQPTRSLLTASNNHFGHQASVTTISSISTSASTSPVSSPSKMDNCSLAERVRRRSAAKNPHCPPPAKRSRYGSESYSSSSESSPESTSTNDRFRCDDYHLPATNPHNILRTHQTVSQSCTSSIPSSSSTSVRHSTESSSRRKLLSRNGNSSTKQQQQQMSQEEKCREIRDLHNSMERQRRVDLKVNFDNLKFCIPELADVDKASKLNILNKATEYCKSLVSSEAKLRRDVDKEQSRHDMLQKKLSMLQNQLDNGRRLSSGRLSVLHGRHMYD